MNIRTGSGKLLHKIYRKFLPVFFLTIASLSVVNAQNNCAFGISDILQQAMEFCADTDINEACYGNPHVNAVPRINTFDFVFAAPGDREAVTNIQSLSVDSSDQTLNTWGIAQIRLSTSTEQGIQDVTMLLFGRFDLENAIDSTETVNMQVETIGHSIYSSPDITSEVVDYLESGTPIVAIARLEDNSWLRIIHPATNTVGWIENQGIAVSQNDDDTVNELPIQDASTPYYSPMQAFYFENGRSDLNCDSVATDGLLIQTPDGIARVSLLINEVSIEMLGNLSDTGETQPATIFIQSDQSTNHEMVVDVFSGTANVESYNLQREVNAGQRTSIPLSVDLEASGIPELPTAIDANTVENVGNLFAPHSENNNNASNSSVNPNSIDGITNNPVSGTNSNSTGSDTDNFEGIEIDRVIPEINISINRSSGGNNTEVVPTQEIDYDTSMTFDNFSSWANIFFLSVAIISGVILLAIIIVLTIRRNRSERSK